MNKCLLWQYQVTRFNPQLEATNNLDDQTRSDNGSHPAS